jgi:hypothetical protein
VTCTICGTALGLDVERYACQACEHAMAYALRRIVVELPLLRAALPPGSAPGGRRPVGRAHSPLPVTLAVLDLLGPGATHLLDDPDGDQTGGIPLGPLLAGWIEYAAGQQLAAHRLRHGRAPQEDAVVPSRAGGIPGLCVTLTRHLPYAVTRPWAQQLHADLRIALQTVRAVTGSRPQTRPRLAPCPDCAAFALSVTDGEWHVRCQACGHRMEPDAYAAHASAVLPGLTATAVQIAAAACVVAPLTTDQPTTVEAA